MTISAQERERISQAIHAAEAKTSGEIVCVLARSSSHLTALPVLLAAAVALALPWVLLFFTALSFERMLSLQILVFLLLTLMLSLPRVRVALIPRKTRRAIAHRVAMEQFATRDLARKKGRASILIFVSLAERYARIIADDGIAARVPQSHWQTAVDALIVHVRDGRIADGFVTAIERCGKELAEHFPRDDGSRDQLPDRIHII
jgi:putative membrane protein